MKPLTFLGILASIFLVAPATGWTRDRDRHDHRSHNRHDHRSHDHGHRDHGHYDYRRYPSSVYYRSYRPYNYGYYGGFYGSPYYSSYPGYYYGRPSLGITITRGSSSRYDDDDLAVDVQRALARRGYYRGSIDGDVGPGTRSAIRQYQYDRRLEVTGRIDSSLLRSLNLS